MDGSTDQQVSPILIPDALPHQIPVLLSPARHKVLACGRRWGKTVLGLLAVIRGHGPTKGALPGAGQGAKVLWAAPTYGVLSEIWRDVKRSTSEAWLSKSEIERRVELPNGGIIKCGSTDNPDTLRGPGWDGVVIDEAAFCVEAAWRDVIRPALTDRQGWSIKISTPNGYNWFHAEYAKALLDDNYERWQRPTSENPVVPQEELDESLLDIGPRAFAQEHLAHFTDVEGAEFDGKYFHDNIWFDKWPESPRFKVIALDPSKGKTEKSDYSAFAIILIGKDGKYYVDCDMARRDVRQIIDDGIALAKRWKPDAFGVETNQFQEVMADDMYERAKAAKIALPLWGINNQENKITRIRATLTPRLARDEVRFLRSSRGAKMLIEQLRAFPVDDYDDGPDALEMGIRLARDLLGGAPGGADVPILTQ